VNYILDHHQSDQAVPRNEEVEKLITTYIRSLEVKDKQEFLEMIIKDQ